MKLLAARCMLAAALLCAGVPAVAHRFHIGLAEIGFNPKSGSVEVVHTLMAHDIEALLATLGAREADLTRPEDEALLRKYIESRFYLLGPGKERLPLKWVGMQAGVDSVTVYQELPNAAMAQVAQVHNALLSDLLPRQSNTVNVRIDGEVQSLEFDAKTLERRIQ